MNGKDLLTGMSYVEDRFIEEAEHPRKDAAPSRRKPVLAFAACLCLILTGVWMVKHPSEKPVPPTAEKNGVISDPALFEAPVTAPGRAEALQTADGVFLPETLLERYTLTESSDPGFSPARFLYRDASGTLTVQTEATDAADVTQLRIPSDPIVEDRLAALSVSQDTVSGENVLLFELTDTEMHISRYVCFVMPSASGGHVLVTVGPAELSQAELCSAVSEILSNEP